MGCEVKWDAFGVRCIYSDNCTDTDCREALEQINTRYGDMGPIYVVHDFTDVRELENGIAALVAPERDSGRVGTAQHSAVVSPDNAVAALVETYAAQASRPMHVFRSRTEAEAWLLTLFT